MTVRSLALALCALAVFGCSSRDEPAQTTTATATPGGSAPAGGRFVSSTRHAPEDRPRLPLPLWMRGWLPGARLPEVPQRVS